jgi:hypothetical protein
MASAAPGRRFSQVLGMVLRVKACTVDYPQFNLLFGLALALTNTVGVVLLILHTRLRLSGPLPRIAQLAQALSLLLALAVGVLFVRTMIPALSRQIAFGTAAIAGLGALVTAAFYRVALPSRAANLLIGLQLLATVAGLVVALALLRTLTPLPPPPLP